MRIRSIKPEFWRSDDISNLDIEDRFLFIGLWSYVDDNGVGLDKLASIVADLFADDMMNDPRDTIARVSRGLQHLFEAGLIVRYEVDNTDYLSITNWEKHQRIDRPNKPRFPQHSNDSASIRDTLASVATNDASGAGEQGSRGTVLKTLEQPAVARAPKAPNRFEEFWAAYPRKVDKKKAKDAFDVATKTTDPELIIAGAMRHAADPNRTDQFTKHPTTWLRAGSWDNEPLPPRNDTSESQAMKNARSIQQRFHQPQALDEPWLIGGPNGNPERN